MNQASNKWIGSRSLLQHFSLYFKDTLTERKYLNDSLRYHKSSLKVILIWFFALVILGRDYNVYNFLFVVLFLPPLVLHRTLSQFKIRVLSEPACACFFIGNIGKGSMHQSLGCFIPLFLANFFTYKRWTGFFAGGLFQIVLGYFANGLVTWWEVISFLGLTVVSAMFEKDFRDIWVLYTAYKKSDLMYYEFFQDSPNSIMIVNLEGKILNHNQKASYLKGFSKNNDFASIFEEEYKGSAKRMIANAMDGQAEKDEFLLKKPPLQITPQATKDLGCLVKTESLSWLTGNSVKVTCRDISPYIARRIVNLNLFRSLQSSIELLRTQLFKHIEKNEPISKESLANFYKIKHCMRNGVLLHSSMLSIYKIKKEVFDVNIETQNIIDICFLHHRGLSMYLYKCNRIPSSLKSDRQLHNQLIFNLMEFAVQNAKEWISLTLELGESTGEKVTVDYTLNFKTANLSDQQLKDVCLEFAKPRLEFSELIQLINKFGPAIPAIDPILKLLEGKVVDSSVHSQKVTITISLSFVKDSTTPRSKLFPLDLHYKQESSGCVEWKSQQQFKPGPTLDSMDGSVQFANQLKLVKKNRNFKTVEKQEAVSVPSKVSKASTLTEFGTIREYEMTNEVYSKMLKYK